MLAALAAAAIAPFSLGVAAGEVTPQPALLWTRAPARGPVTAARGAGLLITGLFFTPAPPRGIGMQCAAPDVYSYAEVEVTGAPCGPVVIPAR